MTDPTPTDTDVITDAAEMEKLLTDLETALSAQLEQLKNDQFDEFMSTGEQVAEMLKRVTTSKAQLTSSCFEAIKRIHGLHRQLGLALQTRSAETAEDLQKAQRGKNGLKAYKNSAGA